MREPRQETDLNVCLDRTRQTLSEWLITTRERRQRTTLLFDGVSSSATTLYWTLCCLLAATLQPQDSLSARDTAASAATPIT